MFAVLSTVCTIVLIRNRNRNVKNTIENLRQKNSTLYIKYDLKKGDIVINNKYSYLNLNVSKYIVNLSKTDEFIENIKRISKDGSAYLSTETFDDKVYYFSFYYRDKNDDCVILRCDYNVEKTVVPVILRNIEDLKKIHSESENKKACFFYLNIKDFNNVNQRYGQKCGDYVLEVIKNRIAKIEKNNLYCCYLGADQFGIYYNSKSVNKKKSMNLIKEINRKLTKPVDVGYIYLDLIIGIGVCVGEYESLEQFIKCAYVASDYAKKRKKYNIVLYNEAMKLEDELVNTCEKELNYILDNKEININYNPVFYNTKSKFIGYISNPIFTNPAIKYEELKKLADQKEKGEELLGIIIDNQLINFLKKRPKKRSKLFISLKLEDLPVFLETYLSNPAYSDCKIVVCLNVKKGYEMLNKFSYISSTISKLIEEGVEFALEISYSNMYNYDYILKNSSYLILDDSVVSNMNNMVAKNKFINIMELAKNYELELFAIDIKEYIQYENLMKYNVNYFSGSYFGKAAKRPNDIEQSKTKIFAKFIKDSKKNKKN
jgi:diguanylate cyclase (GGDEF)-like protein